MKKKLCTGALGLLIIAGSIHSCKKGNEEALGGNTTCDTVGMTYTADVVPILQANCYSCHGNGNTAGSGGVLLEGYANIEPYAANGYLVGNVTHAPGYNPMPYGLPALPACEQDVIVDWVKNGYQNN
jgi:hypothetical protein